MNTFTRNVQISMWVLAVVFGLRALIDIVLDPLLSTGFEADIPELWWRLLLAVLTALVFMVLWNAYRVTQRWSWTALLVAVLLFFGGSIVVLARLGDTLWLIANIIELAVALGALAFSYKAFFET